MAKQTSSLQIQNLQRTVIELNMAYDATIEAWTHALDVRDKESPGHTQRVTEMTVQLAKTFGIGADQIPYVQRGALLHDIGKLGIPDAVLHKTSSLSNPEWVLIRQHPRIAYDMLSSIAFLFSAVDIPHYHHEKWDGTGYADGLKGEQIPLTARIFAVVDVYESLTSDRLYRKAWPEEKARDYLEEQSGKHFDPRVVETFLRELTKGKKY
ncbi:MAG: HD domain-containing phosphohydrolase [Anaerolineales bacterium]